MWMPLIIFLLLALFILVAIELRERKRTKSRPADGQNDRQTAKQPENTRPQGCCGTHLVCEKETLLNTQDVVIYYDDEELDSLAGIPAENLSDEQQTMLREVFSSLREEDVAGWCKSLQMRNIQLPADIREEALLIVREWRSR